MKQSKKLLSQNELAHKLGISKSTFSTWIKNNGVRPEQIDGQRKLYAETVIEQYKHSKKPNTTKTKNPSIIELLQQQINSKDKEIEYLKSQIKIKDEQITKSNELVNTVSKLATQAQSLNLADKDESKLKLLKQDAERSNMSPSTSSTINNSSNDNARKPWYKRIFERDTKK